MDSLLSKIIKFNKLTVVGINKHGEGNVYYILNVKKNGSKLNIISSITANSKEELLVNLDKKVPVLLVIDGKGVLNKKIDSKSDADILWKRNLDFNTIHFTEYTAKDATFISFCRKNMADDLITEFIKEQYEIVDFYLGPLLSSLLQTTIASDKIHSNDYCLYFKDKHLYEISKSKEDIATNYTIGDTTLSQYHLPLYSACIHFYVKQAEVSKSKSVIINREDILYKKSFTIFGIFMLGIFFTALLTSYMLIQYYSAKNIALNQQNIFSNKTLELINNLENQKERKLKILGETGQLSNNFLSYYAYELAKSIPAGLQAEELRISPLSTEVKQNSKVILNSNTITLKGIAITESSFDVWLTKLKDTKWIKKFEIISLKQDKKNNHQFEIKIFIK